MPLQGTQKGDVYSFGIILEEIILRNGAFSIASEIMSMKGNRSIKGSITKFYLLYWVCMHVDYTRGINNTRGINQDILGIFMIFTPTV